MRIVQFHILMIASEVEENAPTQTGNSGSIILIVAHIRIIM